MPDKKEEQENKEEADVIENQDCPFCHEKALTLTEAERDVPYFGKVYIFSMSCSNCKVHKADVEAVEQKKPCKYTFEVESEKDLNVRIVKSSEAIVKIPHVTTITPGPASNGYITNVEGIINRVKRSIEIARDSEDDDPEDKKKAKNLLKKIQRVLWGREKLKIIIEDQSGNSAIISDKAVKSKL